MTPTEEFDSTLDARTREMIDRARGFARDSIGPNAKAWEYTRQPPVDVVRQACRAGFAGIELPVEWGGSGLGFPARMRVAEEFSRHDLAFAFSVIQHHNALVRIAESGDPQTARALLPRMLDGELIGCTAMSEPSAGSDFAAIATRADRVPGGWRLTGRKAWITNAATADVFLTYAQTDPSQGNRGIACFVVRSDMPGFLREPAYELHAAHATGVGGYELAGCFVPDSMVLYPPGAGFKAAMQGVNRARIHVAAMNAGMLDAALATATAYAGSRRAFGASLLDFQGLRWSLVDVAVTLDVIRLLAYRGARLIDAGADAQEAAAIAKKFANERTLAGVEACMQAMGANGLLAGHALSRHLAAAKLLAYTDGTTEMMNERIGQLLRKRIDADGRA